MLTRLLIPLLLVLSLQASSLEKEYLNMSVGQKSLLVYSMSRGIPDDLGFTLAAICWQESKCGLYPVNVTDPSFGLYHKKVLGSGYRTNKRASKLLLDNDFAATTALSDLKYWIKNHSGSWSKAVMSYNAGHRYKNGSKYLENIRAKILVLRKYYKIEG